MIEEVSPVSELTVLELALRLRWNSVVARATSCPEEISVQDEDGLTVLHWACCNPPPIHIFEALLLHIDQVRQAACTKDMNSMTPLHCACACQAPVPVISLLIEACPDCVEICDEDGWTPLHFLTVSVRKEEGVLRYIHALAQALLADHPILASAQDSSGRTVLEILCVMYQVELHRFYLNGDLKMNDPLKLFWDVVCLLVDSRSPPNPTSTMMHRLVSFPQCPVELLMCTCRRNPELLLRQDGDGNTPLHLAVNLKAHALERFLVRATEPVSSKLRNQQGELPFDVAIRVHKSWTPTHLLLLEANPNALETLNIDDVLYPRILVRTNECTVFQILRARPNLVSRNGA